LLPGEVEVLFRVRDNGKNIKWSLSFVFLHNDGYFFSCALLKLIMLVFIFFTWVVVFKISLGCFSCIQFASWSCSCYHFYVGTRIGVNLPTLHCYYFHVNHVTFPVLLILRLFSHHALVWLLFSHWCLVLIALVCYFSRASMSLFSHWCLALLTLVHFFFARVLNPFYVGVMALFALVLPLLWCLCCPSHAHATTPLTLVLPLLLC